MDAEGAVTQITKLQKPPANPAWSPDGNWIGFSMFVPRDPDWRIDLPAAPSGAQWTKAPRIVGSLHYRADRAGYLDDGYTHLFVVPATGGTPRQITRGDWNVGSREMGLPGGVGFAWLPDGKTIIVDGNDAADAERQYRRSNLYAIDVATGTKRRITSDDGGWSGPVISPDGRLIAFTGQPAGAYTYHADDCIHDCARRLRDDAALRRPRPGSRRHFLVSGREGIYFAAQDRGTSNIWYAALGSLPGK